MTAVFANKSDKKFDHHDVAMWLIASVLLDMKH